jgi:glycosyltransferase involved in cell wall biosynthesis
VLEAALAGCALVLSDIATFRELWHGAALFVPASDPSAAWDAVNRLIDGRELRMRLAAAAQRRARSYAPEACVRAPLAVYRRVLERAAWPLNLRATG